MPEKPLIGSSPRMRGTLEGIFCGVHALRLIPTYAGNTRAGTAAPITSSAHPHVCGEHHP